MFMKYNEWFEDGKQGSTYPKIKLEKEIVEHGGVHTNKLLHQIAK